MELTFNTIVTLGIYIITGLSFYWKMRIDIAALNLKIEELKDDRNKRWSEQENKWCEHDRKQENFEKDSKDILKAVNDVKVDVGAIKEALSFLKKG